MSLTILNPDGDIDNAIIRRDWFGGFAIAVSYFELYGFQKLSACARHRATESDAEIASKAKDELKRLKVGNIVLLLHVLQLIDKDTYSDILQIITERNKLVHFLRRGPAYRYQKRPERATELLEKAKVCIRKLQAITIATT